jgi:hypothetical protein
VKETYGDRHGGGQNAADPAQTAQLIRPGLPGSECNKAAKRRLNCLTALRRRDRTGMSGLEFVAQYRTTFV